MTEALAQTVLLMGMSNYAFYTQTNMVGYKLRTFPLRTLFFLYCVLYVGRYTVYVRCGAVLGRCGPM